MPNFTKQAIKQSFWELLEQRPLSQITVKDIAEHCGINRNSFYYHFQDIPSLIEEIFTEQAEQIIAAAPSIDSIEECLLTALRFATQNRKAIAHIYNSVNRFLYEQYLWEVCQRVVELYLENAFPDQPLREVDRLTVSRYYRCLIFGAVMDWMNTNSSEEEAAREIRRLCELKKGAAEEMIRRCREGLPC